MTRSQRRKKAYYKKSMISIYASIAIVLHDQNGWGKKRITRLLRESTKRFEEVEKDTVTLDELLNICRSFKVEIDK